MRVHARHIRGMRRSQRENSAQVPFWQPELFPCLLNVGGDAPPRGMRHKFPTALLLLGRASAAPTGALQPDYVLPSLPDAERPSSSSC